MLVASNTRATHFRFASRPRSMTRPSTSTTPMRNAASLGNENVAGRRSVVAARFCVAVAPGASAARVSAGKATLAASVALMAMKPLLDSSMSPPPGSARRKLTDRMQQGEDGARCGLAGAAFRRPPRPSGAPSQELATVAGIAEHSRQSRKLPTCSVQVGAPWHDSRPLSIFRAALHGAPAPAAAGSADDHKKIEPRACFGEFTGAGRCLPPGG